MADKQKPRQNFREVLNYYLIDSKTMLGKVIDIVILLLNLFAVGLFVIDTYSLPETVKGLLWIFEIFVIVFFVIEYMLRVYASEDRLNHITNIYSIIDLVAILPTLPLLVMSLLGIPITSLRIVHTLRILRVFRIFRFLRFTADPNFFFGTISWHFLKIVRFFFTIFLIFFISSGMFYFAENQDNPWINNYGDAFYFSVVTLTTVGFGDITPVTESGRWIVVTMILSGIILLPWQASQIIREWMQTKKKDIVCRKCGLRYHDPDASHCKACGNLIYQEYENV